MMRTTTTVERLSKAICLHCVIRRLLSGFPRVRPIKQYETQFNFFLVNLKHGSVPMHACGPSSKPLLVLGAQSVHPDRRAQLLTSYVICCDKAVGLFR